MRHVRRTLALVLLAIVGSLVVFGAVNAASAATSGSSIVASTLDGRCC
jgi:hypothetical protein